MSGVPYNSDAERIAGRARADQHRFRAGLGRLADTLAHNERGTGLASGDPLAGACHMIFRAMGGTPPAADPPQHGDVLARIEAIARQTQCACRMVRLDGDVKSWVEAGPVLVFGKADQAPMALIPDSGRLLLINPATGTAMPLDVALAAELEPGAFMFMRELPDRPVGLVALVAFGLRGCGNDVLRAIWLGLAGGLAGVAAPVAAGFLVNNIIPSGHRAGLGEMVLLLLAVTLGAGAFELTRAIAILRIQSRQIVSVQAAIVQRLVRLPAAFFRAYGSGELALRALGGSEVFRLASEAIQAALFNGLFGFVSWAYLFTVDWRLGLVASALAMGALAVMTAVNAFRLVLRRRTLQIQGDLASRVFQLLSGISKIRTNGAEKRAFALWAAPFARQKSVNLAERKLGGALEAFNAGYVILTLIVLFAAVAVINPDMSTGNFVAFNTAFAQFFAASTAMIVALTHALNAIPLYERSTPILKTEPEPEQTGANPRPLQGGIDISRVNFRYHPDAPPVLDDVSISIPPGSFTAIVGPSGSGKSTLLRLLLGFERPNSGAIYYDGQDLAGLIPSAVRRQLGVVLQNGKLMPGELYTNIIGARGLTIDDAWAAARQAGLEDDIKAMPMGMHTVIAEGAGVISGGQRQRLMIARALAGKPRILLFDEATSALDNQTQAQVAESLQALKATRLVIAHRLSTVIGADQIVVLERGKVVEAGTYTELMTREGRFAELARRQLA